MDADKHFSYDELRALVGHMGDLARLLDLMRARRTEVWRKMHADGVPLRQLAHASGVSRVTIYRAFDEDAYQHLDDEWVLFDAEGVTPSSIRWAELAAFDAWERHGREGDWADYLPGEERDYRDADVADV